MNSTQFTRWLRAKQLPILFSILLLAVTVIQTVHELTHHDALHSVANCEYCVLAQGADVAVLPEIISLIGHFVDNEEEVSHSSFIPLADDHYQQARAPPQSILSIR
jgi:hypothetical protein